MKGYDMVSRKTTRLLSRFFQFFAIAEIVIFSAVATLCKLLGELSRTTFANGLFIAAAIVFVISGFMLLSARNNSDSLTRYLEMFNPDLSKERVENTRSISDDLNGLTMRVALIGIVPLVTALFLSFVRP
jgi:hypothetical protein